MPEFESLRWERAGHVATITLDRPEKLNAMSAVMFREIGAAFEAAAGEPEVRCVVVAGEGRGFCSGADLTDPDNMASSPFELKDRMHWIHRSAAAVMNCPKPTIAKVEGIAAGAGCNLALGCDFVVATPDASFAELFVKRGLVVDFGGSWALSRALPLSKAKELAFLGETIDAAEAERLGLLYRLCAPEEIDAVVKDLAERLAALPPRSVAGIKETLNRAYERSLEESLDAEANGQAMMFASDDTREAVTAWVEKREPRFTGR
ncbi:MAG: enoyl-CoA hydratase-related protein [Actinomycetota bacterium]|nr:enoyl-CoA hydratase-related protein [Actinomycetota bacterium]